MMFKDNMMHSTGKAILVDRWLWLKPNASLASSSKQSATVALARDLTGDITKANSRALW
jgi:hypothetical protein